jgi:hypothetical protein
MRKLFLGLLAFLLASIVSVSGVSSTTWKTEKVTLVPRTEHEYTLTVKVSHTRSGQSFELSGDVTFASVDDCFVSGDKLVVLGGGGGANVVVIFDLLRGEKIDWFYCFYPQRVSQNWIAYVEWVPRPGSELTHIVLLYDLTKSPDENRVQKDMRLPIPAPNSASPVGVGIPIFPETNARLKSYLRKDSGAGTPQHMLAHTFCLLPPDRLLFIGIDEPPGKGGMAYRDYLVVVDLSRGIDHPVIKTLDIPKDQLKRHGENPNFVQVERIEAVSATKARLVVRETGESILVNIPQ